MTLLRGASPQKGVRRLFLRNDSAGVPWTNSATCWDSAWRLRTTYDLSTDASYASRDEYAREPVTASEPTYRYFPRDGGVVVGTYRLKQRQVLGCADKPVAGSIGSGRHRWACCDFDNLDRLHPSGTLDQEIAQHGDCQQQHHVHGDQHPHRRCSLPCAPRRARPHRRAASRHQPLSRRCHPPGPR